MRLYPPVPFIQRQAVEADTIGGYHIPAGSWIGIQLNALHHHPGVWENPEGFDPERFSPANVKQRHRFAYLPFGGGGRSCIGNNFAMMEAKIIVAMIAQAYRMHLVPGHPVVPDVNVTQRPRDGILMTLQPRQAACVTAEVG
jgi:cytochrome P450